VVSYIQNQVTQHPRVSLSRSRYTPDSLPACSSIPHSRLSSNSARSLSEVFIKEASPSSPRNQQLRMRLPKNRLALRPFLYACGCTHKLGLEHKVEFVMNGYPVFNAAPTGWERRCWWELTMIEAWKRGKDQMNALEPDVDWYWYRLMIFAVRIYLLQTKGRMAEFEIESRVQHTRIFRCESPEHNQQGSPC